MPRIRIEFPGSTALAHAEYDRDDDADTGSLDITFSSGSSYTYDNVPERVFTELREASSPGSYFHRNIKNAY